MRPLIYFPKEKDGSIYQTARLRKNIKAAFEHLNVPYYEKNRGNIDIALFGSLRNKDINQIKKCKKRNIPTIFFALYQESDSFSELVKIKRTGQLYISKKDLDSLNEIDLILVPSEEAKRYLKSFGVNAEIKTLFTPVNVERFNSEHVLEKTIFNRYFRLKEDTKIIIGTTNTKNVEGVEMFSTLANRFQDYVFFYFIETNSFKDRLFVKKLSNKNPSNLIVRSLVNDDVFRSGLMNANFYIETSNKKVGTLSLVDTFASETHLIACKNAIYNDVVDENVASVYLTLENIINIIEKGESSYDKQRKNALKRAEKASISNFANKLKEIIETLLNKRKQVGR